VGGAKKNVDFNHRVSELLTPSKLQIVPIEEYENDGVLQATAAAA